MNVMSAQWENGKAISVKKSVPEEMQAAESGSELEISEPDKNGIRTVSGKIASGEGIPVSILIKNTSLKSDRFGGIRYIDCAVSKESGGFRFDANINEGGLYCVCVKDNGNGRVLSGSFEVPMPKIGIISNRDMPGVESDIIVTLENGENLKKTEFDIVYDESLLEISGEAEFEEGFSGSAVKTEQGKLHCIVEADGTQGAGAVCSIPVRISENAEKRDYSVSVENGMAYDGMNDEIAADFENTVFTIGDSPIKNDAYEAAKTAMENIGDALNIKNEDYESEYEKANEAREKFNYALSVGVKQSRFAKELRDKLAETEKRLLEIKHELDAIAEVNSEGTAAMKTNNDVFAVSEEMFALYDSLEEKNAIETGIKEYSAVYAEQYRIKFENMLALETLRQVNSGKLFEALKILNPVLKLDLSGDFADLDELKREEVMKKIARAEYGDIYEIKRAFSDAVKSVYEKKNSGSSGGGSKSSGGVTSNVPLIPKNEQLPANTLETNYEKCVFKDMDDTAWARKAVEYLAEKNIVNGTEKSIFSPNENVKREEFITMLARAFNLKAGKYFESDFVDVDESDWYYEYVKAAAYCGLVNGYEDGSFGAGRNITRQEMTAMLARCAEYSGVKFKELNEETVFDDAELIAPYAAEYVKSLQRAGVINGIDGSFKPNGFATRAMAAKVIYGIMIME